MNNTHIDPHTTGVVTKAQTDRGKFLEGLPTPSMHASEWMTGQHRLSVQKFTSWIFSAATLNANKAASVPLRMYVRKSAAKVVNTRPLTLKQKNYLNGYGDSRPHPIVMQKAAEFGDDFAVVTDMTPPISLLQSVNPWMNGYNATTLRFIFMELVGNSYLHPIMGDVGGFQTPIELWPLLSQFVTVIPGENTDEFIKGYRFGTNRFDMVDFTPDEIIQFKRPNPHSLYYGMGKVEAILSAFAMHEGKRVADVSFWENNARPDYAVIFKGEGTFDEPMAQRLEARLRQVNGGARRAGKFAVLPDNFEMVPLSFPDRELGDPNSIVEEIAAAMGTPVSMLKANDPNLASAKVGFGAWLQNTIHPMLVQDEQELNQSYLTLFEAIPEGDAFLAYDNPVPEDKEFQLNSASTRVSNGTLTINEARAIEGLAEIEGGDVLRVNGQSLDAIDNPITSPTFTFSQVSDMVKRAVADSRTEPQAVNVTVNNETSPLNIECSNDKLKEWAKDPEVQNDFQKYLLGSEAKYTKSFNQFDILYTDCDCGDECSVQQKAYHAMIIKVDADDDIRDDEPQAPEDRLARSISKTLVKYRDRIITDLLKAKGATAKVTDADIERALRSLEGFPADMAKAAVPEVRRMLVAGGAVGLSALIQQLPSNDALGQVTFTEQSESVIAASKSQTVRLAGGVEDDTNKRVSALVRKAVENGNTVQQLSKAITDDISFSKSRAKTIARTEMAQSYIDGQEASWNESGVVAGKKWLLAPNACEFCKATAAEFKNKVIPLGEPFYAKGETVTGTDGGSLNVNYREINGPPLHPNDRCDLVAVLITETE